MLSNIDECKVMHLGLNNVEAKYEMNGKYLEEVIEKRQSFPHLRPNCVE